MQVLKSFNIVVLLPDRFGRIHLLRTVYPVQWVITFDTGYGHLLYRTENNHSDLVFLVLVLHLFPWTISIRGKL